MDKELLELVLKHGGTIVLGDNVATKHVENQFGNIEAGGIGVQQIIHGEPQDTDIPDATHRPGARKQFLFIGKKATEENVGVKNCEKERFLRYLREHKMSSKRLVTEKNDGLNKVVVCFLKQWAEKGLTAKLPSGGAVFRFLTADCRLETDVQEKSYANKITEWLGTSDYDVTTYLDVKAYFK